VNGEQRLQLTSPPIHVAQPRWSPDGHYIAALSSDSTRLLLFDIQSQRWTELAKANFGYPTWSSDGEYIYFDTFGADPAFCRVRIRYVARAYVGSTNSSTFTE
jgi:Tol biopolymer transport system component